VTNFRLAGHALPGLVAVSPLMPDSLYWQEIEPGTPGLDALGLQILEVSGEYIDFAASLPAKYGTAPSPMMTWPWRSLSRRGVRC